MFEEAQTGFMQTLVEQEAELQGVPRIYGPFEAIVRGTSARGERFECETSLDDVSAEDCNLRLEQPVETGARLFIVARLYKALVAMHVVVLRAERESKGGLYCLSLGIIHNRFLS